MRVLGIVLLVGGVLAAVYGGFTYIEDSESVDVGVAEVTIQDKEHVSIPLWVGLGGAAVGALLILADGRRRHV